jgi:hypothetical protein
VSIAAHVGEQSAVVWKRPAADVVEQQQQDVGRD